MKKAIPWLSLVLVICCIFCTSRSCRSSKALAQAQADYNALKAASQADQAAADITIHKQTAIIASQDATISTANASIATKAGEIRNLKASLDALHANLPPVAPEVESLPLVINLRQQVSVLTEMVKAGADIIDAKDAEIEAWSEKFDAQADISAAWKAKFDSEFALRIAAENLAGEYHHYAKTGKVWRNVAIVAGAVAAGLVIAR